MKKIILILFIFIPLINLNSQQSRKEIVAMLFKSIEDWYGTRYLLGGKTKDGIDCSSFVAQVYKEVFNIELPKRVSEQKELGELVKDELQPGDVLFFKISDQISHEGIYIFNNKFVHAASAGQLTGVIKSSLNESYYKKRFVFAKRFIKLPPYKKEDFENPKPRIFIGKYSYKDIVFNISEEFIEDENIYIQVKSDKNTTKLNVNVINSKNILVKKIYFDDIKVYKINLKKGDYRIQLVENNNKKLDEKNILVK
jgi:lipoprotein Spr